MNKRIVYGFTLGMLGYLLYSSLKDNGETNDGKEIDANYFNKEDGEISEKMKLEAHKYNQKLESKVIELNKKLNQMKGRIDEFKESLNTLEKME